jgi:hypothetical protein
MKLTIEPNDMFISVTLTSVTPLFSVTAIPPFYNRVWQKLNRTTCRVYRRISAKTTLSSQIFRCELSVGGATG